MYFVWMNTPKGPMPQWWSEDLTLTPLTGKDVAAKVISKHKTTAKDDKGKEYTIDGLTLNEWEKVFPCPVDATEA